MSTRNPCAAAVRIAIAAGVLIAGIAGSTEAQTPVRTNGTLILGEITSITISDANDPVSAGRIVVDGKQITLPDKLLIGLPSGSVSLRDLMLEAPAECQSHQPPQSGLAVSDSCRGDRPPALARVVASANASGELVASVVMIQKDSGRTLARIRPQRNARARSYGQPPQDAAGYPKPSATQAK